MSGTRCWQGCAPSKILGGILSCLFPASAGSRQQPSPVFLGLQLQLHNPCLCLHLHVALAPHILLSSSYKDSRHSAHRVTLLQQNLFFINYTRKDPVSKSGHILRYWGLGF